MLALSQAADENVIRWRSALVGLLAYRPWCRAQPRPRWCVRVGLLGFWAEAWTPAWHGARGPYLNIGLGVLAVYRSY